MPNEPCVNAETLSDAEPCYRQGMALLESSEPARAEAFFRRGEELSPTDVRFAFGLGKACQDLGRLPEALRCYERAIRMDEGCAAAHYNMGVILLQTGRNPEAEKAFRLAIGSGLDAPSAYSNLGVALQALERTAEALSCFDRAAQMAPAHTQACCNAGRLLFGLERWEEACERFRQAVVAEPRHAAAWHNLGLCAQKLGELDAAERCYRKALELAPQTHAVHIDMGNVCLDRGDLSGMAEWYRKALHLAAADAAACLNVARMFKGQGRFEEALEGIDAALRLDPQNVQAHFERAAILLAAGDWLPGWEEYEWRFRRPDWRNGYPHLHAAPRWDGSRFDGKTLLVHCEQGFGDSLQFARYLPLVKARGGRVLFELPAPLTALFEGFPGVDALLEFSPARPASHPFDLQTPLLSLPRIFKTTPADLPGEVPYLKADPDRARSWGERLPAGGFKIGVVWASSGWTPGLARKSFRLADFLPLAQIPSVRLYGLQKGPAAQAAAEVPDGLPFVNLGERFTDFADTAAVLSHLDLVISVDTAVAHLAGAMAKPVWVVLAENPDWRWLRGREDSPWYPTMRLFRQEKSGGAPALFGRIAAASQQFVRAPGRRGA
jgi:tetratricopeptide (TPR) repeat protein